MIYQSAYPHLRINVKLKENFTTTIEFKGGTFDTDADIPDEVTMERPGGIYKTFKKSELSDAMVKTLDQKIKNGDPIVKIEEGKKPTPSPKSAKLKRGSVTSK